MRRSQYLKKKFEYYEHMKGLNDQAHKYVMERLKLEITRLETLARRELVRELTEHILSDKLKAEIVQEIKERVLTEVKIELDKKGKPNETN